MRSEYSWIRPEESAGRTEPNQLGVSFSQHRAAVFESDGRTVRSDIAAGAVFVTGPDAITWLRVQETTEALEIFPDLELLGSLAAEPPELRSATATRDGTVLAVATLLKRLHLTGSTLSDIEASTLAHRVAAHMIARYSSARPLATHPAPLDRRAVDRIAEFVDAELAGKLTLDRLARVASLSPFHFARSFKAATGLAPHQFVTARRLDQAKAMLLGSGRSVADAAIAVGMPNLSHFRRMFRRHNGILPGELRR